MEEKSLVGLHQNLHMSSTEGVSAGCRCNGYKDSASLAEDIGVARILFPPVAPSTDSGEVCKGFCRGGWLCQKCVCAGNIDAEMISD